MSTIRAFLDSAEANGCCIFTKRLAANDTRATGSHQVGLYVPKAIAFEIFPSLKASDDVNPRVQFDAEIVSHGLDSKTVNIIWYNNKTRDECHITRWGGSDSPVLDPDATGSLCIYAFEGEAPADADYCRVWLCCNLEEEEEFESRFDIVDPGFPLLLIPGPKSITSRMPSFEYEQVGETLSLWADLKEVSRFPTGMEIVMKVAAANPELNRLPIDERLMRRRDAEFAEFRRLEAAIVLPMIREGFGDVDKFVDLANSVTNRRKSRSGRSLELQLKLILDEENIVGFSHDEVTERSKRPDFIFPSMEAYKDPGYPNDRLRMLACKTTCKDRWRQVIDEADRIDVKHLLTLQEGVSDNQFSQMKSAGIELVVPRELHKRFPARVRKEISSVEDFVTEIGKL